MLPCRSPTRCSESTTWPSAPGTPPLWRRLTLAAAPPSFSQVICLPCFAACEAVAWASSVALLAWASSIFQKADVEVQTCVGPSQRLIPHYRTQACMQLANSWISSRAWQPFCVFHCLTWKMRTSCRMGSCVQWMVARNRMPLFACKLIASLKRRDWLSWSACTHSSRCNATVRIDLCEIRVLALKNHINLRCSTVRMLEPHCHP